MEGMERIKVGCGVVHWKKSKLKRRNAEVGWVWRDTAVCEVGGSVESDIGREKT